MKKLLIAPILLVIAIAVSAATIEVPEAPAFMLIAGGGVEGSYCTTSICTVCDEQERFECGATDGNEENTWTVAAGSHDQDNNASTGFPGAETDLLAINSEVYMAVTGTDGDHYIAWMAKIDPGGGGGAATWLAKWSNGSTYLGGIDCSWLGGSDAYQCRTNYNSGSNNSGYDDTNLIEPDTLYYWKLKFNNGSTIDVFYSLNGTDWTGFNYNTISSDVDSSQITRFALKASGEPIEYKCIRTDTADIDY